MNAVLALGASTLLPMLQPVGAVFLAMLVLARGTRAATVLAVLAGGTLAVFAALVGAPVLEVVNLVAIAWLPVYLLALLWQATKSVVLTLQLSVFAAIGVLLGFHFAVGDLGAFWDPILAALDAAYLEQGAASPFAALREQFESQPDSLAVIMTTAMVAAGWLFAVVEFMLGGALYEKLPGERRPFGRFRDVDFGRVLALTFVVVLVLAYVADSGLLRQVGLVMFAAFLLQGFVVVHWLHLEKHAPVLVVFLAYGLVLVLQQYAVIALAVTGYLDAWFRIRRRLVLSKGSKK